MMKTRDTTIYKNLFYLNKTWLIDLVLIKSNPLEVIDTKDIESLVCNCLSQLEKECISPEFIYYRTGVVFVHFGRRGVELTVWHFGRWDKTSEYFCCTWYCYKRGIGNMELLDNCEPHFSQYEVDLICKILPQVNEIALSFDSNEEFKKKFINLSL